MPTLIDTSYFFGDIPVGQLSEQAVKDKVQMIIDQREPEYLEAMLGYDLYKQFEAGRILDPMEPRWKNLLDGVEYTDIDGRLQKWQGLIRPGSKVKRSPIAYYVYYWYLRGDATKNTGTSESQLNTQNGTTVSPKQKQVTAWNQMYVMNIELYHFLNANRDIYEGWEYFYYRNTYQLKFFKKINTFGI